MEYIFGTVRVNGETFDNAKTVGTEHTNLSGKVTVVQKYTDCDYTDTFDVVEKYHSDQNAELCYDWYIIKNHYRYVDKFTPGIKATEQTITDLEIENMANEQALTDHDIAIMELQEAIINR